MKRTTILGTLVLGLMLSSCNAQTAFGNHQMRSGSEAIDSLAWVSAKVSSPSAEEASILVNAESSPTFVAQNLSQTSFTLSLELEDSALVPIADFAPELLQELRYASDQNFTAEQVYDFNQAFLRYGTLKKLLKVQKELRSQGLSLKIWDAYRPVSAQQRLWDSFPDPNYVSNPAKGASAHCRGNTVDVTLMDAAGNPLPMPSDYDDFTARADRDYSDCSTTAASNAQILEQVMEKNGFRGYTKEWWHYTDETSYSVEDAFEPMVSRVGYPKCQNDISLRTAPDAGAAVQVRIPKDGSFLVLATHGEFFYIRYCDFYGYVLQSYTTLGEAVPLELTALFTEALSADGAQTEAAAARLAEAFRQDTLGFTQTLSRLDVYQIEQIARTVVMEYPADQRQQLRSAIEALSGWGVDGVISAFLTYLGNLSTQS